MSSFYSFGYFCLQKYVFFLTYPKNIRKKAVFLEYCLFLPLVTKIVLLFTKFLISKDGETVRRYAPTTDPKDFEHDIEAML